MFQKHLRSYTRSILRNSNFAHCKAIKFGFALIDDVNVRSGLHRLLDAQVENGLAHVRISSD